ncbi:MAG TPA: PDZ domain-containing protein, partial [Candidatus Hydrogenedentes bacterium]|nr:PDZ domain-containing protein [Candidatus Hydrogenedentota bacterium]
MVLVDIIVFILVLGLLVFVHELGHFIAAKSCGVYVDRFSLGMPPRLFGKRIGETDYCISALPIGGYVKMAGQEDKPLTEEERETHYGHVPSERWLNNKPRWQRFMVFAAGPLMNFVLAIVLYAVIAGVGAEIPQTEVDNRIGAVEPGSPAAEAPLYLIEDGAKESEAEPPPPAVGWQMGDRILSVDGSMVKNIRDLAMAAALGKGETLRIELERTGPDGVPRRYYSPVRPRVMEDEELSRVGVAPFVTPVIVDVLPGSPAAQHGLQAGDVITRMDDVSVDTSAFMER